MLPLFLVNSGVGGSSTLCTLRDGASQPVACNLPGFFVEYTNFV